MKKWTKAISGIVAILILLAGCGATALLFGEEGDDDDLPQYVPRDPLIVETMPVAHQDYQLQVPAYGFVEARKTVEIRAEVSGKVVQAAPGIVVGAHVKKGTLLLAVDDRDYVNRLEEASAVVEQAQQALEIEKGLQAVAKAEWELLGDDQHNDVNSKALALRQPQLKEKEAAIRIAQARQAQASLEHERTKVYVPCDGQIVSENLIVGQHFQGHETVLTVACTDSYHIRASFGAQYVVRQGDAVQIEVDNRSIRGIIKTKLPSIDSRTRQKQVLVEFKGSGVPLGSYAALRLSGRCLDNVVVVPTEALRPGSTVWTLSPDNTLKSQAVKVLAEDCSRFVLAPELAPGTKLVLSHIANPLQGMKLRCSKDFAAAKAKEDAQDHQNAGTQPAVPAGDER